MAWSSFESITSVNLDPKQGSCRIPIGFLPAHTDGDTFHSTQAGQIGMQPCLAPFSIVQHQRHCWSSSRERLTIPLITLHCIEYESSWKWFYSPYPIISYFPKPLATRSDFHVSWGTWLIQVTLQITWVALRIMKTCMHPILSPQTQSRFILCNASLSYCCTFHSFSQSFGNQKLKRHIHATVGPFIQCFACFAVKWILIVNLDNVRSV